jgi:hypothetical protein
LSVELKLERRGLRVSLRWNVAPGPEAQALREQFDRNGNGSLEGQERTALGAYLSRRALGALTVEVEGTPLSLSPQGPRLDVLPGASARITVTLTARGTVSWQDGDNRLGVHATQATDVRVLAARELRLATGLTVGQATPDAPLRFVVSR